MTFFAMEFPMFHRPLIFAAILVAFPLIAEAGGGKKVEPLTDALTLKECGSCHMAFQPEFLPVRSWEKLMGNLTDHFGADASLSEKSQAHILAVLKARAADVTGMKEGRKMAASIPAGVTPLRISEVPRWVKEHGKIQPNVWARPDIKSKANCLACHTAGEQGYYED
jgi:hypothetical protein